MRDLRLTEIARPASGRKGPRGRPAWAKDLPPGFPLTPTKDGFVRRVGNRTRWVCTRRSPAEALRIYQKKYGDLRPL